MFHANLTIKIFVFALSVLTLVYTTLEQSIGTNCVQSNGQLGTCEQLSKCPSVINSIRLNIFPTICSYLTSEPVICCIRNEISTTTTTTPKIKTKEAVPVHVQKCQKYGESVFKLIRPPLLLPGVSMQNVSLCARKIKPTVIGGEEADPGEFPHMAIIGYGAEKSKSWNCGGDAKYVRLGDLNINTSSDRARPQNFLIVERIMHPNYTGISKYNDIALLKLDKNAIFDEFVRPACLSNQNPIGATTAIATGWGETEYAYSNDHLLKVTLNVVSYERCNNSFTKQMIGRAMPQGINPETQMCAGGLVEEKDTCQGDSGGPLQINNDNVYCMYDIIGITSLGSECGTQFTPGIYTKVATFIPWIEQHIWKS